MSAGYKIVLRQAGPHRIVHALAVGGALLGLTMASGAASAEEGKPVTLTVSSNSLAYGGLKIAQQAGLFEKNGIALKVIVSNSGNAATTALVAGSADFSGSGTSEVLAARVRGQDIVIVSNIFRGLSGSLVLARPVADKLGPKATASTEAKLKALDGLTIATPSPTSAYTHPVKSAAEALKVKIKFVYMSQPAMVAALKTGAIQGFVGAAPYSLTPVTDGSGVMWLSGPKGELPAEVLPTSSACLQGSAKYVDSHPDIVKRMQAAFFDLKALIEKEPAKAKAALAKAYPKLKPSEIDAIFEEDSGSWTRPIMTPADIKQEIHIQASSGSLAGVEKLDPAAVLRMPK
jgi:ABC-type nitrate/sulfonate/bicarbonate transport system substrate-binding protein